MFIPSNPQAEQASDTTIEQAAASASQGKMSSIQRLKLKERRATQALQQNEAKLDGLQQQVAALQAALMNGGNQGLQAQGPSAQDLEQFATSDEAIANSPGQAALAQAQLTRKLIQEAIAEVVPQVRTQVMGEMSQRQSELRLHDQISREFFDGKEWDQNSDLYETASELYAEKQQRYGVQGVRPEDKIAAFREAKEMLAETESDLFGRSNQAGGAPVVPEAPPNEAMLEGGGQGQADQLADLSNARAAGDWRAQIKAKTTSMYAE